MKHSSQSDRVINPILCILILDCIVAPWKLFFLVSHGFRIHTRNNWCFCGTFSVQIVILVQKSHRSIFQGSLLFFLLSIARLYLEHNPLRVYWPTTVKNHMPSLGSPKLHIFKPSTFLVISQLAEGVLYRFLDFQEAGSFLYLNQKIMELAHWLNWVCFQRKEKYNQNYSFEVQ